MEDVRASTNEREGLLSENAVRKRERRDKQGAAPFGDSKQARLAQDLMRPHTKMCSLLW